jgi:hypothetical protein
MQKNTDVVIDGRKEVGQDVNTEKSKYMLMMMT